MDFLDNLVLPQSSHHMVLLKYLLVLTFILFIPYLSVLLGSTFFSIVFKKKGSKSNEVFDLRFAKGLIDLVTFNKSIAFGFGVIPLLSANFCYAQLLHMSGISVSGYLLISLILFIISVIFIYTYKYSFHLKDILSLVDRKSTEAPDKPAHVKNDLLAYKSKAEKLLSKSGVYGLIFLLISVYLFIGAVQFAADSTRWQSVDSILGIILSWGTIAYFIQFLAAAFAITSAALLYVYFRPNSEHKSEYAEYLNLIKKFSLKTGLIFTLSLPVLVIVTIFTKPAVALSSAVFGTTVIVLFLLLIIGNIFYNMLKSSRVTFSSSLLVLFILVFAFGIIKDQLAFDTATHDQFIMLSSNYEEYEKNLLEELGISTVVISGEDIFNGRCIACHQFEQKLVGPPYNSVIPKYEGKQEELVEFILNPKKVDDEYPPMPSQGLKPKEAEAIAEYIVKIYKEKNL